MTSVRLLKNGLLRQNALNYNRRNYQLTTSNAKMANSEQVKLKSIEDIPGPEKLPLVGNVLEYLKHEKKQHLWFQELQQKYGDIIKLEMGLGPTLIYVFSPEYAKAMCKADGPVPDNFGFENFQWYRNIRKKDQYPNGQAGIIGSYLPIWREVRTAVNPVMARKNSATDYLEDLNGVASKCIDRIAEKRDANNEIHNAIPDVVYLWALEGMTKIFLDANLGFLDKEMDSKCKEWVAHAKEVAEGITEMQRSLPLWKYMDVSLYKKFDKASDYIYHESSVLVNEAITRLKETKENEGRKSMIAKLVDTFGEDSYIPVVMALDAILAGMDTTAFTASYLLQNLARNPIKQEKAIEEIDKVTGGGIITAKQFDQLRYLKACFKESIRMTPATNGTARRLTQDVVMGEYLLPKGTQVIQLGYVIGNNPKYFPEPHKYMPERWLRGDSGRQDTHPFAFIPFGFGPRICIGKRIAETEVVLLAAKMLQRFRMEYHHEPVGFSFASVNQPDRDMRIELFER